MSERFVPRAVVHPVIYPGSACFPPVGGAASAWPVVQLGTSGDVAHSHGRLRLRYSPGVGFFDWFKPRRPPAVSPGRAGSPGPTRVVWEKEIRPGVTVRKEATGRPVGYVSPYLSAEEADRLLALDADGLPNLRVVEFRGEWWLAETSTGRLVNAGSRALKRLGIWSVRVRGDAYAPGALRIGPVELVREPDNEFDPNAVAIHQAGVRCGYWNKGAARSLAKLLDGGVELTAYAISANPPKVIAAEPRVIEHLLGRLRP